MTLRLEQTVIGFQTRAGQVTAVVTDHGTEPAGLVILGLGVRPTTDLAARAGIPLGVSGAIAVDQQMRTGADGVWATGDCAEMFHRVSRRQVAIAPSIRTGVARCRASSTALIPVSGSSPALSSAIRAAQAAARRMCPTWCAFAMGCRYAAEAASPAARAASRATTVAASFAARCASSDVTRCSLVRLAPLANAHAASMAARGRGSSGCASPKKGGPPQRFPPHSG